MIKNSVIILLLIFCKTSFANEFPASEKINAALETIRKSHNIPALSVAIVDRGNAVYAAGFGYSDADNSQPVTENTLFRVASITKLFTAQAIVQLIEDGEVNLSDQVNKYIGQFNGSDIKIIDLITHTSGLSDSVKPTDFEAKRTFEDYLSESLSNNAIAMQEKAAAGPTASREFEYADLNFNILGKVVEVASGLSYFEYIQSNILKPLDIRDSGFKQGPGDFRSPLSPHYNYGFVFAAPVRPYDPSFAPSEGLIATVNELSVWVQAVLSQDQRLLDKRSYLDMLVPRRQTSWGDMEMGLGWQIYHADGELVAQHAGSVPGYKSLLITYPEKNRAIIILANAEEVPRWEIAKTINAILDNREYKLPESGQWKIRSLVAALGLLVIFIIAFGIRRKLKNRFQADRT